MTEAPHPLPEFLLPATEESIRKESRVARIELEQTVFAIAFNHILDETAGGTPLVDICMEHHTQMNPKHLMSWILRNPERKKEFEHAEEIGTRLMENDILRISDALDNPMEDVARSKLKSDNRWKVMRARNPKRYGDTKDAYAPSVPQININIGGVESPYATIDNETETVTIDG